MATKDEIVAGLNAVIERLNRMAPDIEANATKPLTEGTWTVRDCLAHVAADGNAVPRWQARVESVIRKEVTPIVPGAFDAANEDAIQSRSNLTMKQLLTEARAGRQMAIAMVAGIDESLLQQEIPRRDGGVWPASDLLNFLAAGHDNGHLDDIEKALGA